MENWLNKYFFVKEKGPRVLIGLVSAAIGVLADIGLYLYRISHEAFFLNQYGPLFDKLVRFFVGLGVCMVVLFTTSGIYNFWKRRSEMNEKK